MRYLYFILFSFMTASSMSAQESVFYTPETDSSFHLNRFGLKLYNLNFFKNNEYFNHISDGLTLLGTQVQPEFIYNITERAQLRAGLFLMKHFGENKIASIIPTFSFHYKTDVHHFTMGNLYAKGNHRLIEPMMASEKILRDDVIETGLEYKYHSEVADIDLWLNWENYIRKYDPEQEMLTLGISSRVELLENLYLPIQFLFRHRGGQINLKFRTPNNPQGVVSILNLATGLQYSFLHTENEEIILSYYFLTHKAESKPPQFPFKYGNAHYVTLEYKIASFKFLLAYYKADKFVTARGNEMFQTYSLRSDVNYFNGVPDNRYKNYTEPDRTLLFSKVYYEWKLTSVLKIGFQVAGYFQLNKGYNKIMQVDKQYQFDYSYGVYVVVNDFFSF